MASRRSQPLPASSNPCQSSPLSSPTSGGTVPLGLIDPHSKPGGAWHTTKKPIDTEILLDSDSDPESESPLETAVFSLPVRAVDAHVHSQPLSQSHSRSLSHYSTRGSFDEDHEDLDVRHGVTLDEESEEEESLDHRVVPPTQVVHVHDEEDEDEDIERVLDDILVVDDVNSDLDSDLDSDHEDSFEKSVERAMMIRSLTFSRPFSASFQQ
eukprot:TRINITY_DN1682_c0_g2_i1.p1 TRINITY_DN1682_c0_g2~~TRINITY_DN1682_c0_g2_i1.p1  ORF type:complete len:211 (-),score=55.94 TRINITY_DN1682_c0_g2_i1:57-689(-)